MAKIGHFEILELVGRGAMGAVYRAVDPVIGRLVAIKVIRLMGYNDGQEAAFLKERLFQEARAAGNLSHPGIVTVHQLGTQDDQAYIVMEFIDGSTLESRLTAGTPADAELRRRVLLEVAAALDYAHGRGVVHRDIKPANIMLTAGGSVKITDFGIAKTLLGHTVTKTGMILGTPFYMSPEQVRGQALDGKSDQFALAVIAYQMLTGRRPFQGDHVTSICYQIVHAEPLSVVEVQPGLPAAVARVLKRGLEKDPRKRFASCTEFASALIEASEAIPCRAATVAPVAPVAAAKPRRAPRFPTYIAAIVGGIAALGLIVGATWLLRARQPSPTTGPPHVVAADLPAREEPPADPPAEKSAGRLIWIGPARRGALVRIDGGVASTGSLYGSLPGGPVRIRVYPAERNMRRLTVFTSDAKYTTPVRASTAAGLALFSWDPRHMTDVTLWEMPGPGNNWKRCVLRVNSTQLRAFVIEWVKI
jgi:serine/threonine-protein kinase